MRDDHAFRSDLGSDVPQASGDIFIRQAVKAVAPHALAVEVFRNREMIGDRAVTAMECRIEARDLRQLREARPDAADRREVVGLMQRRQRTQGLQFLEDLVVDQDRPVMVRSSVDHPMTDRHRRDFLRFP